jgi:hypothetical protein
MRGIEVRGAGLVSSGDDISQSNAASLEKNVAVLLRDLVMA